MRFVADTNSIISGLLWGGQPGRLIDAAILGQVHLVSSLPLLIELDGVLARAKFAKQLQKRGLSVRDIFDGYAALVEIVTPAIIAPVILRDPDDDMVLATAIAANVQAIVSGDAHLLDLKVHAGIPILTVTEALREAGL